MITGNESPDQLSVKELLAIDLYKAVVNTGAKLFSNGKTVATQEELAQWAIDGAETFFKVLNGQK
jgi:hydroxymethylpyrimidine pyrophosphatase-like HAD family hydrolase